MTNTFDRDQLVEDYVQQIIDGMDYKTMERFVYDTLEENLTNYTDEELITEVTDYYPELLEDWLVTLIIQRVDTSPHLCQTTFVHYWTTQCFTKSQTFGLTLLALKKRLVLKNKQIWMMRSQTLFGRQMMKMIL